MSFSLDMSSFPGYRHSIAWDSYSGHSILFSFLLAAIGTNIAFDLLAKMTAIDPWESSFCYYTEKAYGKWISFSFGWNYWCSSILITGSNFS